MTSAVVPATEQPTEAEKLEAELEAALKPLTDLQRAFVTEFAARGDAVEAAKAAGYSAKSADDLALRLRRNAKVAHALRCAVALRESTADLSQEKSLAFLEAMLAVRLEDLVLVNANGTPIGVRDLATLGAGQTARIKRLTAVVRRSAGGERAHLVTINIELIDALSVLDRIAKLRGWTSDSPNVAVNVATASGDVHVGEPKPDPLRADWAEVLDVLLDDQALKEYFAADEDRRRVLLRAAVLDLKRRLG